MMNEPTQSQELEPARSLKLRQGQGARIEAWAIANSKPGDLITFAEAVRRLLDAALTATKDTSNA